MPVICLVRKCWIREDGTEAMHLVIEIRLDFEDTVHQETFMSEDSLWWTYLLPF